MSEQAETETFLALLPGAGITLANNAFLNKTHPKI